MVDDRIPAGAKPLYWGRAAWPVRPLHTMLPPVLHRLNRKNGTICRQPGACEGSPAVGVNLGITLGSAATGRSGSGLHHAAVEARRGPSTRQGVPCSATRPLSSTTMWSAPATVRIRWAMTSTVLPASRRERRPGPWSRSPHPGWRWPRPAGRWGHPSKKGPGRWRCAGVPRRRAWLRSPRWGYHSPGAACG